jgi:hypothetical protein
MVVDFNKLLDQPLNPSGINSSGIMEIVRQCVQEQSIDAAYATWTKGVRLLRKSGIRIDPDVELYYQDMMLDEFERVHHNPLIEVNSPGNMIGRFGNNKDK